MKFKLVETLLPYNPPSSNSKEIKKIAVKAPEPEIKCPFKGYEIAFIHDIKGGDDDWQRICYNYIIDKYGKDKYDDFDTFMHDDFFNGEDEINSLIKEFNIPFVDGVAVIVAEGEY